MTNSLCIGLLRRKILRLYRRLCAVSLSGNDPLCPCGSSLPSSKRTGPVGHGQKPALAKAGDAHATTNQPLHTPPRQLWPGRCEGYFSCVQPLVPQGLTGWSDEFMNGQPVVWGLAMVQPAAGFRRPSGSRASASFGAGAGGCGCGHAGARRSVCRHGGTRSGICRCAGAWVRTRLRAGTDAGCFAAGIGVQQRATVATRPLRPPAGPGSDYPYSRQAGRYRRLKRR